MTGLMVDGARLDRMFGDADPGWTAPIGQGFTPDNPLGWECEDIGHMAGESDRDRCMYCGQTIEDDEDTP